MVDIDGLKLYNKRNNKKNKYKIKKLQRQKQELKDKVKALKFRIYCMEDTYQ